MNTEKKYENYLLEVKDNVAIFTINREHVLNAVSESCFRELYEFLCEAEAQKTIAVFSHGGSGACVLAHLLALPFPYVCTVLPYDFTSIIILEFPVCPGEYVHPRIELFNDAAHIRNISSGLKFQQESD